MKTIWRGKNRNAQFVLPAIAAALAAVFLLIGCDDKGKPPSPVSATTASSDGVRIYYEVRGRGNPSLVFVHGWSCDSSYWTWQVPYFSKHYKVVTVDLAGHGKSGLDREKWTIAAFGADVAAVVKKLDLKDVVLVGHSMGGDVVVEAAQLIPRRLRGLVLVDSFRTLKTHLTEAQLDRLLRPFRSDFAKTTDGFVRSLFSPTADPGLVDKIAADMSSAPRQVGLASLEALNRWRSDRLRDALAAAGVPIIAINSDARSTDVASFETAFCNFKFKIMSGAGHFLMIEDPEAFNHVLGEAIKEL